MPRMSSFAYWLVKIRMNDVEKFPCPSIMLTLWVDELLDSVSSTSICRLLVAVRSGHLVDRLNTGHIIDFQAFSFALKFEACRALHFLCHRDVGKEGAEPVLKTGCGRGESDAAVNLLAITKLSKAGSRVEEGSCAGGGRTG